MKKIEILVVEDEPKLAQTISDFLRIQNYEVETALTGNKALEYFCQNKQKVDLILLDLMLPDISGYTVLKEIRKISEVPVIILSARSAVADQMSGFEKGADDYITKPFSVSELMARVEALARRVRRSATADDEQAGSEPDQLVSGPFVLDEKSRVLYKSGKPIDLTQVEFQIMELFFRNPGTALVREKILEGVWGKGYFGDVKIVDVNIRRLRMKVEDEPSSPQHILTVWGYGYRWNA